MNLDTWGVLAAIGYILLLSLLWVWTRTPGACP
jgi:hypothetical protein